MKFTDRNHKLLLAAALLSALIFSGCEFFNTPEEESDTVFTFQGNLSASIDGAVPQEIAGLAQESNQASCRTRDANPTSTLSGGSFTVTAKETDSSKQVTATVAADNSFSIALNAGTWTIEAKYMSSVTPSSVLFSGQKTVKVTKDGTLQTISSAPLSNIEIFVEPNQSISGEGSINFTLYFSADNPLTYMKIVSEDEAINYSDSINPPSTGNSQSKEVSVSNVPSGIYNCKFSFYNDTLTGGSLPDGAEPAYEVYDEIIYIYDGLNTNTWSKHNDAEYFNVNGTAVQFTITQNCIDSFTLKNIYVDADAGNDNNSGTRYSPLQTLDKALAKVENSPSSGPFTIHLSDEGKIYPVSPVTITKSVTIQGLGQYKDKATGTDNDNISPPNTQNGTTVQPGTGATGTCIMDSKFYSKQTRTSTSPMFKINTDNINVTFKDLTVDGVNNDDYKFDVAGGAFIEAGDSDTSKTMNITLDNVCVVNFINQGDSNTYISHRLINLTSSTSSQNDYLVCTIRNSLITKCTKEDIYSPSPFCNINSKLVIDFSTVSYNQTGNSDTNLSGGCIYNTGTLLINNSVFKENSINSGKGGVLYNKGTCTITRSTFEGNNFRGSGLSRYGAAIHSEADISISDSKFNGNYIKSEGNCYGGAISLVGETASNITTCTLTNCTFTGNYIKSESSESSPNYGGAIYIPSNSTVTVENSTFKENYIQSTNNDLYGGAICIEEGSCTITGAVFECNHLNSEAQGRGGAIYNYKGTCIINKAILSGNYINSTTTNPLIQSEGGAIYSFMGTLTLGNGTSTTYKASGADIENTTDSYPDVIIGAGYYSGQLYGNANWISTSTKAYGIGVYIENSNFTMKNDVCIGSYTDMGTDGGNTVEAPEAHGVALYITGENTGVNVEGGSIRYNGLYPNNSNTSTKNSVIEFDDIQKDITLSNLDISNNILEYTENKVMSTLYIDLGGSPQHSVTFNNVNIHDNSVFNIDSLTAEVTPGVYSIDSIILSDTGNSFTNNYYENSSEQNIGTRDFTFNYLTLYPCSLLLASDFTIPNTFEGTYATLYTTASSPNNVQILKNQVYSSTKVSDYYSYFKSGNSGYIINSEGQLSEILNCYFSDLATDDGDGSSENPYKIEKLKYICERGDYFEKILMFDGTFTIEETTPITLKNNCTLKKNPNASSDVQFEVLQSGNSLFTTDGAGKISFENLYFTNNAQDNSNKKFLSIESYATQTLDIKLKSTHLTSFTNCAIYLDGHNQSTYGTISLIDSEIAYSNEGIHGQGINELQPEAVLIELNNSKLSNGTAAIILGYNLDFYMKNYSSISYFTNNNSQGGAAIFAANNSTVFIENSSIIACKSDWGSLRVANNASCTLSEGAIIDGYDVTTDSNTGSGVYLDGGGLVYSVNFLMEKDACIKNCNDSGIRAATHSSIILRDSSSIQNCSNCGIRISLYDNRYRNVLEIQDQCSITNCTNMDEPEKGKAIYAVGNLEPPDKLTSDMQITITLSNTVSISDCGDKPIYLQNYVKLNDQTCETEALELAFPLTGN